MIAGSFDGLFLDDWVFDLLDIFRNDQRLLLAAFLYLQNTFVAQLFTHNGTHAD